MHPIFVFVRFLLLVFALAACGDNAVSPSAPLAPTGLTVTPGEGKVILQWQDKSDDETGFSIYRQEASATAIWELGIQQTEDFEQIGRVGANVEQFEDTEVTPGTLYRYGVTADGEKGSSARVTTEKDTPVQVENRAPRASAPTVETDEDTPVAVTLVGADPEGDTLTYTVTTQPIHGVLSGDVPDLTYTPNKNYNGTDSFTYTVSDGDLTSAETTVVITVASVNDASIANDREVSTEEDLPVTITLSGNDTEDDALTFAVAQGPSHGKLGDIDQTTGKVVYTPNENYNGADSFTFTVSDGDAVSAAATVTLDIGVVNDAPVANAQIGAQAVTTQEDIGGSITLNASDVDGDALTYEVVADPEHGTLSGDAPNLTYTPDENYNGADSFTFKANDGLDDSNEATVEVVVNPVNDAPSFTVAPPETATTYLGDTFAGTVSVADVDSDTFTLTASVVDTSVIDPTSLQASCTGGDCSYSLNAQSEGTTDVDAHRF